MDKQTIDQETNPKIISINESILARMSFLGNSQKTYREQYLTLVNFLAQLKNTSILYEYIPTPQGAPYDYQQKAKDCHAEIDKVVEQYADYISDNLEHLPGTICNSLIKIDELVSDANDCAKKLANGTSENKKDDINSILLALYYSQTFINKIVVNNYKALLISLDNLYNGTANGQSGDLLKIETDLKSLVNVFTDSSKFYTAEMEHLQAEIDNLRKDINSLNMQVAGGAITMGTSVFLGASAVSLLLASGVGIPAAVVAGAVAGVFFATGAVVTADAIVKINEKQKIIESESATLRRDQVAIVQMDNYNATYSGFVRGIEDVKTAVTEIKNAWENLADDFEALANYIKTAADDTVKIKVNWTTVGKDLDSISALAKSINGEVKKLDVADVQVSDGKFDFSMNPNQMSSEFEKSHKMSVTVYLKTA